MPSPDGGSTDVLDRLAAAVAAHGLLLRGGFHPLATDHVPAHADGRPPATVVLIGSAGPVLWAHFARERPAGPQPLDRWTRATLEPIARRFDAAVVFPFDKPPLPFQRWAMRAAAVFRSPLGLLIDPHHGLWHALRGAFLFSARIKLPERPAPTGSPCASCRERPCLAACPVGAFAGERYDTGACARHIGSDAGAACMELGCRARAACPVGRAARYPDAQVRFHMAAFRSSVGPHS